jgi:dipeptidyl aminopeptidase/acylaminoacyl peptidase
MRRREVRHWIAAIVAGAAVTVTMSAEQGPYSGHGAAAVTPEVIARYAPPPLDADVSRRIQMMLDVRAPGIGMSSPDGRRLFFQWSITGTPAVWRLDGPRLFPVQMTAGEDPTTLEGMTPDGRLLILSRDRGGQEDPGLYVQPADGGALTPIHHKEGTRATYGFTSADSEWVYFTANDIKPDSYAVYRYNLRTRARELLLDSDGLWSIADRREAPEEVTLLLRRDTGALTAEYAEWSAAARRVMPVLGHDSPAEYEARYAPDPGTLFVLTNRTGEFRRLYLWRAGVLDPISPESSMDVSAFRVDDGRRRVYYIVNDGGYSRLRVLDAATRKPLTFPDVSGVEQIILGSSSPDGRYVSIGFQTGRTPTSAFVYDWANATLVQWVVPAAPETDLSIFVAAQLENYQARDGTSIPMFVRYPSGCAPDAQRAEPCPVVVEFHGGPEEQALPGFNRVAQLFVDAGFVYVQPNVRGSDGYGKSWLDADNGAKRSAVLTDIEDCARALKLKLARGERAPRIGVFGGSYGGYAALIGMTLFAGAYDAGVSIVGISNFDTFLRNTAPYRRALRISEYGDPDRDAEVLRQLSPITHVDRVKGPLLLIQGVDDPRVPVGEAIQMQEALAGRNVPSELILLSGEGHGAARRTGQALMLGHTLRFFETHLRSSDSSSH